MFFKKSRICPTLQSVQLCEAVPRWQEQNAGFMLIPVQYQSSSQGSDCEMIVATWFLRDSSGISDMSRVWIH